MIFNKPRHIRSIIRDLIGEEDENFALWSFGDKFTEIKYPYDCVKYWNELHGDILKLNEIGNPHEDLPKMIELWKSLDIK